MVSLLNGVVSVAFLATAHTVRGVIDTSTVVQTEYGPVSGTVVYDGEVTQYLSIPFAAPPIDDLRWVDPQPPQEWTDVLECVNDLPFCIQTDSPEPITEDCLYLNVFTPVRSTERQRKIDRLVRRAKKNEKSDSDLRPVMVWIHGGTYMWESGGTERYNGTYMASLTGVVVVSLNYRLGALGQYWNPDLGLYGNYGHLDQKEGILWVRRNIEAFGGDPDRITIYGQSAGATSCGLHAMDDDLSFLSGVIMESNPAGIPLRSKDTWGAIPSAYADGLGCPSVLHPKASDQLDCMRKVKNSKLLIAAQYEAVAADAVSNLDHLWSDSMPWTPTVGNDIISDQPIFAYQRGDMLTNIPVIMGTNMNESLEFYSSVPTPCTEYRAELLACFGKENSQKVIEMYNIPDGLMDCRNASMPLDTDAMFRCPSLNMTKSLSLYNGNQNGKYVYWYHDDHVPSFGSNPRCTEPTGGVCHGYEVPFVFGTSQANNFTAEEETLSEIWRWYWASFAYMNGNVNELAQQSNNPLYIDWLQYTSYSHPNTLHFNTDELYIDSPYDYDNEYCNFWDSIGYEWTELRLRQLLSKKYRSHMK